jgi:Zn-dependent alcohol dehydrogenases
MKSLFITEPGKTEIREVARPEPGRGEVRVRVRYLGYCGSDLNTFRGLNPLVSYPRVPGHELAGVIVAVGPEVSEGFVAGTPVLVVPYTNCGECSACRKERPNACRNNQTLGVQRDGGLAEEIVVPVSKLLTSRRLSLREMVLVEPLSVGWHAARRGRAAAHSVSGPAWAPNGLNAGQNRELASVREIRLAPRSGERPTREARRVRGRARGVGPARCTCTNATVSRTSTIARRW